MDAVKSGVVEIGAFNILVIGNGAREHALAKKINQSHQVENTYVSTGNAGTKQECLHNVG